MSNPDDPTAGAPDVRWWRPLLPNDTQRARYRDQLRQMIEGLNAQLRGDSGGVPGGGRGPSATIAPYPDTGDLADTEFLYRADTILVSNRPDEMAQVAEALGLAPDSLATPDSLDPGRLPEQVEWLRVVPVPLDRSWTPGAPGTLAEAALALIEEATGRSDLAGFDRVIHLAPKSNSGCPATEPVPFQTGPDPEVCQNATLGRGVTVAVIDSGWPLEQDRNEKDAQPRPASADPRWPWLEGVEERSELESAVPGASPQAVVHGHYRGHGVFVAGVVRAMAPAAEVTIYTWGPSTYGQIESELAPILESVLGREPNIISMSAGVGGDPQAAPRAQLRDGRTRVNASLEPAFGMREFLTRLERTQTLLVCAAGNDGHQGPFEPASTPMPQNGEPRCKVAVGALKKDGRLAKYSNRGAWVDVYARGSKVVNAYPDGPYTYTESPRSLLEPQAVDFGTGFAEWSGTSFATPLVAGLVAARMSWDGFTGGPRAAWEELAKVAAAQTPFGLPTLKPGDADPPAP